MMKTTSPKPMTRPNRKNALIRIQKELQYIAGKTPSESPDIHSIRLAIYHVVQAILTP